VHEKHYFRDQSVVVSCMVVGKLLCTCILTIVALMHLGCSRALFGAVGFIMGPNGTIGNSVLNEIYRCNRLQLE
jgi:hypothetical protein